MKEVWLIIGLVCLIGGIVAAVKKGIPLYLQYRAQKKASLPPPTAPVPGGAAPQKKSEKAKSWVSVVTYGLLVLALTGWVVTQIRNSEMDRPRREEILQAQFALLEAERKALVFPSKFSVIAPTVGWSESIIRPDDNTAFVFSVPQGMGRWIECWEDGRTNNFSTSPDDSRAKVTKMRSITTAPITVQVVRHTKP